MIFSAVPRRRVSLTWQPKAFQLSYWECGLAEGRVGFREGEGSGLTQPMAGVMARPL